MRHFSIAAAGLLLFMSWPITTQAADLYGGSYKDEPAPAPYVSPFRWTGFYMGADIGGAWARGADVSSRCSPTGLCNQQSAFGNVDASSFIGGVHAGYNWNVAPKWVLGVEGDFSWTSLDGSAAAPDVTAAGFVVAPGGHTWSRDVQWLASVRGRLGFNVSPMTLLYFTGGVAWQDADYTASQTRTPFSTAATSFSETTTGYVLGGGLEWAMAKNWVIRGEYLYYSFDGESASARHSPGPPLKANFDWSDSDVHSVRAGLSYKF